jgi:hypothetical protein
LTANLTSNRLDISFNILINFFKLWIFNHKLFNLLPYFFILSQQKLLPFNYDFIEILLCFLFRKWLQPLFKIDHTILNWSVFFVNCNFSEVGIFFRNLISDNESFVFWHSIAKISTQNFNPLRRNRNLQKWPKYANKLV